MLFRSPHALTGYVIGWLLSARARLRSFDDARGLLDTLGSPLIDSGEIRNGRAVLCLAEGDPAAALAALAAVLDARAPAAHTCTVVEAHVLAALAHDALGDERRTQDAVERALELAEPERLVLPFVMAGAGDLLEAVPRHRTSHAALLTDILELVHGSYPATIVQPPAAAPALSASELRVLRYLPSNLSRPQIAGELSVSVNTVNTHVRSIYAKLQAADRSSAVRRARQLRLFADNASLQAPLTGFR